MEREKILVVTDNVGVRKTIISTLKEKNYQGETATDDSEALEKLVKNIPDLIITECSSEKIHGISLCQKIKNNNLLRHLPIIFILPEEGFVDRLEMIKCGADDFIEKNLLQEEITIRIEATLERISRYQDLNPVTKLYGVSTTIKELNSRIIAKEAFAVGYADLYRFRYFNARYGFKKGDEALKTIAKFIRQIILELGTSSDFLAHLGEDHFLFITSLECAEDIAREITENFEQIILPLYEEIERRRGFIYTKTRKGEILQVPLLRIHIGLVTNQHYSFISPAQIFQIAKELAEYAKSFPKNMYTKERRKTYPFY